MSFPKGLNVVFGESEVVDALFDACARHTKRHSFVHWMRPAPIDRLPVVPQELRDDPIRLKRIGFRYGGDNGPQLAADVATSVLCRRRGDLVILEQPPVHHERSLGALLALLNDFSNVGNTSIVTLPNTKPWLLVSSLYTSQLFLAEADGSLRLLLPKNQRDIDLDLLFK